MYISNKFIYNSKVLNLDKTIEEEGISKGSVIIVIDSQNLPGGGEDDNFKINN